MLAIRIASRTDRGARQGNEDDLRYGATSNGWFAVVADGAGGHRRGAEAAQRAVASVESALTDGALGFSPAGLTQVVRAAHAVVQSHQDSTDLNARMHCTVVALWIDGQAGHALWTHVGDSRLYRIRRGVTDLVTADDSVVQRMVQAGLITAAQASTHPQKNQLLSALGIDGDVQPHTVVRPVELQDGDAFLLCTDGWWDPIDALQLADSLGHSRTPQEWLELMERRIVALANPKQDNYSAVAVWVGDPTDVTRYRPDDTVPRFRR
ncbi:serine/threonine-protein phosphatase [Aquincola sp. S2]|uniref:Serine/threonine-protein phosphatase n=1 Tax=Pseudaquabacterium terrae TaxID=2732868 RepID=A0ABX2EBZ3_9BURK|nr:serine/threonine-protein phosphatase [Aquabacterium terrae]